MRQFGEYNFRTRSHTVHAHAVRSAALARRVFKAMVAKPTSGERYGQNTAPWSEVVNAGWSAAPFLSLP